MVPGIEPQLVMCQVSALSAVLWLHLELLLIHSSVMT